VAPVDVLRAVWTGGTGLGTLIMIALLREVMIDNWAISQIRRPGTDVLRVVAQGEVWDQTIRLTGVASLFFAGVLSYVPGTGEFVLMLLVLSAAAQVFLATVKMNRRRQLMRTLRLNRKAK
jgi:hypothetical protein